MLKLQTLGLLSLRDGEGKEASAVLSQPKRLALLIYLSVARPRGPHRRDTLLSLFWPERPDTQGRNALSQSLSFLRQNLPEPVISTGGGEAVGLESGTLGSDVEAFEKAIAAKRWRDALDLYRGDFLRGFHIGGAWGFEDWVETERERLREMAAGAAWSLAHEQVTRGALVEAERTAQKALRLVWSDETPVRRFIEALAKAGDGAAALNLYEKFCSRLREELELEPSAVTASVAEAIRNGEIGASPPVEPPPIASLPDEPSTSIVPQGGLTAVAASESGLEVPKSGGAAPKAWAAAPKPAPKRWFSIGVLVGASILATALVTYAIMRNGDTPELNDRWVVVPPFENLTGDPDLDEVAIRASELIGDALLQVEGAFIVPSNSSRQYALEAATSGSGDVVRAVAERAGAGWAVWVTIAELGDSLEFRGQIINLSLGTVEQTVREVGPRTDVDEILDLLAQRLCGALGYELVPYMVEAEAGSEPFLSPPKYEAFVEHQLGYEMFSQDAAASFKHQMAAYALDTTLVRALVAAAYVAPNRSVKDSLATFAQSRRHLLTRQGNLDLDILVAGRNNDAEAPLRAMREAANLDPGGLYCLIQSWFALRLNRPREALDATEGYDPYVEWRYPDAHRYWRERAMAYHMLEDFEAELVEAREGRKQYPQRAGLLFAEVRALVALGRFNEVLDVLYQATGFPEDPTPAMLRAGEELRAHGFFEESKEAFGMATDWLNAMPKEDGEESHDLHLAQALYGIERWGDAQEVALALAEAFPEDLTALGLVGATAARLGDSDLATQISDRLLTMEDPDRPGEQLFLVAKIAAVLGETDRALRFLQEAFSEGMGFELRLHRDMDLESIRDRAEYQALMRPRG